MDLQGKDETLERAIREHFGSHIEASLDSLEQLATNPGCQRLTLEFAFMLGVRASLAVLERRADLLNRPVSPRGPTTYGDLVRDDSVSWTGFPSRQARERNFGNDDITK